MDNLKKEIINNVLIAMNDHIDKDALAILEKTLEEQLFSVNLQKTTTFPTVVKKSTEEQNQYYIELMMIKKKNACEDTKKMYAMAVKRLITIIDKPLTKMDSIDIDTYLHWYEHKNESSGGKKNKNTTCNIERSYLSSFFAWMEKEQFVTYNPVKGTEPLKTIQEPIDYFGAKQIEELRSGCKNDRDRALIEVLRSTGARLGELVALDKTDIDWSTGDALILSEKSNRYRTIYFDESSRYYLKKYLDGRTDNKEALFISNIEPHERLTESGIEYILRKIGKQIGANYRVYPHKMRKTLGMNLRNSGVDLGDIQEILGHASPDTTELYYAQSTPDKLRAIRQKYA